MEKQKQKEKKKKEEKEKNSDPGRGGKTSRGKRPLFPPTKKRKKTKPFTRNQRQRNRGKKKNG